MAGEQAQTHNPSKRDLATLNAANQNPPKPDDDDTFNAQFIAALADPYCGALIVRALR